MVGRLITRGGVATLLVAATRGRTTLIGVVLHSPSSVNGLPVAGSDATTMLNWAFAR